MWEKSNKQKKFVCTKNTAYCTFTVQLMPRKVTDACLFCFLSKPFSTYCFISNKNLKTLSGTFFLFALC